jgi:hypothetical protein
MTRRPRRTPAQWQQIVDQQASSGLAARQFCNANDLNYAVFCKWRNKLAGISAAFVDVSALVAPTSIPAWDVELELGAGMLLRLRRG